MNPHGSDLLLEWCDVSVSDELTKVAAYHPGFWSNSALKDSGTNLLEKPNKMEH